MLYAPVRLNRVLQQADVFLRPFMMVMAIAVQSEVLVPFTFDCSIRNPLLACIAKIGLKAVIL